MTSPTATSRLIKVDVVSTSLAAVLVLGLAVQIMLPLSETSPTPTPTPNLRPRAARPAAMGPVLPPLGQDDAIAQQDIFSQTRSLGTGQPGAGQGEVILVGVASIGAREVAVLHTSDGDHALQLGQSLGDWSVVAISHEQVSLRKDQQTKVLKLGAGTPATMAPATAPLIQAEPPPGRPAGDPGFRGNRL